MARPLRIELAGGLYHVMSRGNERRAIVRDDVDRQRRLDWLERTIQTYGWRLHSFVLMTNHEHLFVETPEPNLSAGMHFLNSSYAGYFNLRHRRVGHLFQGRFKAQLIEEEGHYREISRYLHLNPVRAKLAKGPEEWPWSSYPGYHRAAKVLGWVTYDRVLSEFAKDKVEARRRYRQFVAAGIAQPPACPWAKAFGGLIVGSEAFAQRIRRLLGDRPTDPDVPQLAHLRARPSLEQIIGAVAGHFGGSLKRWSAGSRCDDASRAAAAYLARRKYGYSTAEVARALGYRGHSSVGTAISRIEAGTDALRRSIATIVRKLTNV
jgi:putative transposase